MGIPRLHQGKAVLVTLLVPLVAAYGIELARRPSLASGLRLAAAQIAAVGASATGLWLAPAVAGLAQDDIITAYNGKKVADFEELTNAISANSSGDRITLQILRGDETIKIEATLGEFP